MLINYVDFYPDVSGVYMVSFIVYDDTDNRFLNAKAFVYEWLTSQGFQTDVEGYDLSNDNVFGEDDRICVTVELNDYTGKTFLGHTKESQAGHRSRFNYGNVVLDSLLKKDLTRFYVWCDGDDKQAKYCRVQRSGGING